MNILALDHFFAQDLDSLRRRADGRHDVRAVGYRFFRDRFLRRFPESVLTTDLAAYRSPEHAAARARWQVECRAALLELFQLFAFDLLVLPSDIFPYIRDVIPAAHEIGVPVVVLQKETTISPYTLEVHSRRIGEQSPFIADRMTVCSERQKQFWLNAGASPEKIEITGQPRFDFYRDPSRWRPLADLGIPVLAGRKVILFFSYMLGAYIPIEDFESGRLSWAPLRAETEQTLLGLVNSGDYQLLVKPHPQQALDDVAAMRRKLEQSTAVPGSAVVLPSGLDTRQLIVNADIIVGFQTTALLEALLVGRNVIYTCWGEAYDVCKDVILPYEQSPRAIHSAKSPDELESFVRHGMESGHRTDERERLALCEHYVGPSDGRASERTLTALEAAVEAYRAAGAASDTVPSTSSAERRRGLLVQAARVAARLAVDLPMGAALSTGARIVGNGPAQRWAREQVRLDLAHGREVAAAVMGAASAGTELVGRRPSPWLSGLRAWSERRRS